MTRTLSALAVALVALAGCKGREAEVSGIGTYRFGKTPETRTTRANMKSGVCQPTELSDGRKATWCFALPPIQVGKRPAEVDAYFLGTEPALLPENPTDEQRKARTAELEKMPLIEVQLKVRGCDEQDLEQWMRQHFGPADKESQGNKMYWHNSFLWALALAPSEPGRCLVHILPTSEGSEIERLKKQ